MPTNFDQARRDAYAIAQEVYDRLLLQGYDAKIASRSTYPVVLIRLDQQYLKTHRSFHYYDIEDKNHFPVIMFETTRSRCHCRAGIQRICYTKDRDFPAEQLIAAALQEAQYKTYCCQT